MLLSAAAALVWVPSTYWHLFAAGSDDADDNYDDADDHAGGRSTDVAVAVAGRPWSSRG